MCLPNEILKLFTLLNMRSNHLEYTVENKELDNVSDWAHSHYKHKEMLDRR